MTLFVRIEAAYLTGGFHTYDEGYASNVEELFNIIDDSDFEEYWGVDGEDFDEKDFHSGFEVEIKTGGDWDDLAYAKLKLYSLSERLEQLETERDEVENKIYELREVWDTEEVHHD